MSNDERAHTGRANIGVVGLAVMGANLARNLASREGNRVAVYNRSPVRTRALTEQHPEAGFVASESIDDFVASLDKPRTAIVMVQAGPSTDAVISQLADRFEPGDIIVDGGNANFHDTIRRERDLRERDLNFVGTGISVGTDGAGHFVKMVHNGIEYADMQLIAEAYDLLRRVGGLEVGQLVDVFRSWTEGDLESYLIEITAEVLAQTDAATGQPLVDIILDEAGSKGTGVWTVQNAVGLGIPVSGIGEAVFARAVSSKPEQRSAIRKTMQDRPTPPQLPDGFADDVRAALYASKVVAYAQGFDLIVAGAKEYGWDIDLGAIAKIWRAGCIIRARFLNRIVDAYANDPALASLLADPYFAGAVASGQQAWRRVVATAATAGVPAPGFSSALAYFDSLASERLPASLIQAQRDFFGAQTSKRVDREGVFHTLWSGDRRAIETE